LERNKFNHAKAAVLYKPLSPKNIKCAMARCNYEYNFMGEKPIALQIKKRKWKWIGRTIRKDQNSVERTVLDWNPQGMKKRGSPNKTWKRSVVEEAQREGRTWREVKWLAAGRSRWRSFVKALCSYTGDNRN
jgi:hypothetical protein